MLTKHYRGNNDGVAKVCNGTDMHTLYMHDIHVYLSLFLFTSEVNLNGKTHIQSTLPKSKVYSSPLLFILYCF